GGYPQSKSSQHMLAFFVPTFVSPHLPSSINTPLKCSLLLASNGGHTPPVENQICILRGLENCFRLGVFKSRAGVSSLALSKERARQSSFFCAFCLPYSVCPSGLHRSVKK